MWIISMPPQHVKAIYTCYACTVKSTLKHTSKDSSVFSYEFHIFAYKTDGNKLLQFYVTQYRSLEAALLYNKPIFLMRPSLKKTNFTKHKQAFTHCCKKGLSHHICAKKNNVKGQSKKRVSVTKKLFQGMSQ